MCSRDTPLSPPERARDVLMALDVLMDRCELNGPPVYVQEFGFDV